MNTLKSFLLAIADFFTLLFKKRLDVIMPPKDAPLWYLVAHRELGQEEIAGPVHNKQIIKYHAATKLEASTDEVPWCASFVCWCLEQAGKTSTKSAWARHYLNWGKVLTEPRFGCVVIFKRGKDSGHVGFYVNEDEHSILVLGGNQSDKVCFAEYSKQDLLGFRWPRG